jgi:hypothetical protein
MIATWDQQTSVALVTDPKGKLVSPQAHQQVEHGSQTGNIVESHEHKQLT